jgi:hypothetical protein
LRTGAYRIDNAGHFVTRHRRQRRHPVVHAAAYEHVGAVDADRKRTHANLAGGRLG